MSNSIGTASALVGGSGERVDYVKFLVPLPVEHVKAWKDVFLAVFDDAHIAEGAAHQANVGSVKRTANGDYLYSFEAWGTSAGNVVELPFDQWAPYLHRIDIRRECAVTQAGLDALYAHLRDECGDNRNVQQFNTKARSKRNGRNSGGIGLQVGSHKSDFRVVVYRRHGEKGAVEINLTGDVLKDVKATAMLMRKTNQQVWRDTPWRALYLACDMRGQRKTEQAIGLPMRELMDTAEGKFVPEPTEEELLANIDASLDQMSLTAIHAVYETLQQRLFPHER